jgi:hypothetical protein
VLLASPLAAGATRSSRSAVAAAGGACDWTIHYGSWIPTFEKRVYVEKSGVSGVQCLEACCRDPSCAGLQLESSMESQCYKYAHVPAELGGERGQPLAQYVDAPRQPAWSVFVKATAAGADSRALSPSTLLREEEARVPALRSVQEEAAVDARLRRSLEPPHVCEWTVYYDKWIPSFQGGEYEHNNAFGGAHCLEACCEDPSCKGLALESSEMYQCYKYGTPPAALSGMHGEPLGDGAWLRHRRTAWSIMVKVEKPLQLAPPRARSGQEEAPATAWQWASLLAHVMALVAMVALLVGSLTTALQRVELAGKKLVGGSRDPEVARLLEVAGLHKARPS